MPPAGCFLFAPRSYLISSSSEAEWEPCPGRGAVMLPTHSPGQGAGCSAFGLGTPARVPRRRKMRELCAGGCISFPAWKAMHFHGFFWDAAEHCWEMVVRLQTSGRGRRGGGVLPSTRVLRLPPRGQH